MKIKHHIAAVFLILGLIVTSITVIELLPQQTTRSPVSILTEQQPTISKEPFVFSAILTPNNPEGLVSLQNAVGMISSLTPQWYTLQSNGLLEVLPSTQKEEIIQIAKEEQILLFPIVENALDPLTTAGFLKSEVKQSAFIENLLSTIKQEQFDGITLHWERINPENGDDFTAFVNTVYQSLHKEQKKLILIVPPKTGKPGDSLFSKTYDWIALSKVSDYIFVTGYDYYTPPKNPGPVTPHNWFIDIISYAKTSIPLENLVISLPLYGYDWTEKDTKKVSFKDFEQIPPFEDIQPIRDSLSKTVYLEYIASNSSHIIWMEDSQSIMKKIQEANKLGINQFNFYYLGGEDSSLWSLL